jgi:hypothetical protein
MDKRNALDPDKVSGRARGRGFKGHELGSLGPSDSSDSGSDLIGPGPIDDDLLGLDRGTNEDSEGGHLSGSDPGVGVGDLGADDSSDRHGTGEHLTAGREPEVRIGGDIAPDRIVGPEEAGLGTGLDEAEEARLETSDEGRHTGARDEAQLDREPGSNRGTKGQLRESARVARAEPEPSKTVAGRDEQARSARTSK